LIIPLIRVVASAHLGSEGGEAEFTSWRGRLRPFLLTEYIPRPRGQEILLPIKEASPSVAIKSKHHFRLYGRRLHGPLSTPLGSINSSLTSFSA
jgi:hypothetical protein